MDDKSTDEIVYVCLTIAIPLVIKYALEAFRMRKIPKPPKVPLPPNPASRWDAIIKIFLISAAAWYIRKLINPPYDFITELGVAINAPAFQVRNHFRDYMTERFPGWILEPLSDSQSSTLFDQEIYTSEIRPLEELYDKLRSGKWRRLYGRFGHDAIVNCIWCLDEHDFSIYGAGQVAIEYLIFLSIFGLGTMTPRKNSWRTWIFGLIALPFIMDTFAYSASSLELTAALSKETQRTLYFTLHAIRNTFFVFSVLLIAIWDKKRKYSDSEALEELCKQSGANFSRISSLRLARSAIFGDRSLRDDFLDFYRSPDSLRIEDKDVQDQIQEIPEILRRQMLGESEHYSKEAIGNAVQMQALKDFSN